MKLDSLMSGRHELWKAGDPLREVLDYTAQRVLLETGIRGDLESAGPQVRGALARAWTQIVRHRGSPARIGEILAELEVTLAELIRSTAAGAFVRTANTVRFIGVFDLPNAFAASWAATRSASLISRISNEIMEAIRTSTTRAVLNGDNPIVAAWEIRRHIGLLPAHQAAVARFEAGARANGVSAARAKVLANEQAERYRTLRAETIARTEMLSATNFGATAAWNEAVRRGVMPNDTQRMWIVTRWDRVCPQCLQMTGRRALARLDQPFDTPWGPVMHPPGHPSCRCAVGVVVPSMLTDAERARLFASPPVDIPRNRRKAGTLPSQRRIP